MFNPLIRPNKKIIAFRQWISEKRPIGYVTPLEFVTFRFSRRANSNKPVPFVIDGQSFVGEEWKCIDKDGNFIDAIFKHAINSDYRNNTSLTINKNPIQDGWCPNLLTDRMEEYHQNMVHKARYPNKHLSIINKRHKQRISRIEELINTTVGDERELLFYILRHKQSPTLTTLRSVQKIRYSDPDLYKSTIDKILQQDEISNNL